MRPNILAEKLRNGKIVLGLNNMYPASGIIEGMCAGWDFAWVDGQHGQHSVESILHALQAAMAIGVDTLLRVPGHEHGILGPYADLCPSAIMVPMVDSAEEARHIVAGLRFPPMGKRSYGGRRVIDLDGRDYFRERELLVIAQIETIEGVNGSEAIAATPGIDGLFFGPDDMKVRMGIPINTGITENQEIRNAMERTARAAKLSGKIAGCVAPTGAALRLARDLGYQLIAAGSDIMFIRTAAAARLQELKTTLDDGHAAGNMPANSGAY